MGARRVHERERLAAWLTEHGFLGTTDGTPERPTFLIATSAGEVGVDLDADHMVCDLVEWERMVQRLGRVNRRGEKQSRVEVIAASRKDDEPERLERLRAPLDLLPADEDGRRDASPGALVALKDRAAADLRLKAALDAATTPAPLRPALTRALVDAWSMTSLEKDTGRPEIQPWLRGWETEEPQTTLAWRRRLPWREDLDAPIHHEVERFFGAAPVHLREMLETETHRVVDLLTRRAAAVMKAAQEAEGAAQRPALEPTAPALLVLRRDGHLSRGLTLKALASLTDDKKQREEVLGEMVGATVVVDARLGGLDADGMLDRESDGTPTALDAGWDEVTLARIGYRVVGPGENEPAPPLPGATHNWRLGTTITLAPPEASENSDERPLKVFVARGAQAERRGDLAIARQAQTLKDHHAWAAEEARRLAEALDLPPRYREVLVAAARHHDAGKDRELWQSAMNARRKGRPYAKTEGGGDPRRLNGYRHEFGSLREVEASAELDGLHEDLRDLACHLIVAHHGQGRPTIEPFDPGRPGAWESRVAQESRAREVALRFARLQRRFGPWGLAWLEALLRAADWRASARLDTRQESADQPAEAAE